MPLQDPMAGRHSAQQQIARGLVGDRQGVTVAATAAPSLYTLHCALRLKIESCFNEIRFWRE